MVCWAGANGCCGGAAVDSCTPLVQKSFRSHRRWRRVPECRRGLPGFVDLSRFGRRCPLAKFAATAQAPPPHLDQPRSTTATTMLAARATRAFIGTAAARSQPLLRSWSELRRQRVHSPVSPPLRLKPRLGSSAAVLGVHRANAVHDPAAGCHRTCLQLRKLGLRSRQLSLLVSAGRGWCGRRRLSCRHLCELNRRLWSWLQLRLRLRRPVRGPVRGPVRRRCGEPAPRVQNPSERPWFIEVRRVEQAWRRDLIQPRLNPLPACCTAGVCPPDTYLCQPVGDRNWLRLWL
jgi:hypothetical protein